MNASMLAPVAGSDTRRDSLSPGIEFRTPRIEQARGRSRYLGPSERSDPPMASTSQDWHRVDYGETKQNVNSAANVHDNVAQIPSTIIPDLNPSHTKTIVLCFDGTGNHFRGNSSDSNILKIFRMLDRSDGSGFHYYQPGIGTYVTSYELSSARGTIETLKNWYKKTKDSAIGTSFDEHVVGGYKFLMQYYSPGDDIYMFGFSRGAYTARFLAEMLDWIGLVTFGNQEMIQFAWRTFSEWKQLDSSLTPACLAKRKKAYEFMVSFRETFSRPVKRIRFLGLFDTVNSIPRFENAMMSSHQHMPYSATSSARVIRHAVSIDERRAKFRSDLISPDTRHQRETDAARAQHLLRKAARHQHHHHNLKDHFHEPNRFRRMSLAQKLGIKEATAKQLEPKARCPVVPPEENESDEPSRFRRTSLAQKGGLKHMKRPSQDMDNPFREEDEQALLGMGSVSRYRSRSRSRSRSSRPSIDRGHSPTGASIVSTAPSDDGDEDEDEQDIEELWFAGGHGDIGGGWQLEEGEIPLSHFPLVWIVQEARKCGLRFDEDKMEAMGCWESDDSLPRIEVSSSNHRTGDAKMAFKERMHHCATKSIVHDCLDYGHGLPMLSVLSWRLMEYIPFKRMDLRDDGSWKPIRWPLPRGEVRDMPDEAKIHHSAIKRMQADPNYRPGNLIMGGGGRGVKKAPAHAGIGEWKLAGKEGDLLGECFVRKNKTISKQKRANGATGGRNGILVDV